MHHDGLGTLRGSGVCACGVGSSGVCRRDLAGLRSCGVCVWMDRGLFRLRDYGPGLAGLSRGERRKCAREELRQR